MHFNEHETDRIVVNAAGGMHQQKGIVNGAHQSMEDCFAGLTYLEHTLPSTTVQFTSLCLAEGWGAVVHGQIDWPAPGSALIRNKRSWLIHGIVPPNSHAIQFSKPARLRVTASVNSTPLR